MADRPPRRRSGDTIDYNFTFRIEVVAKFDEQRLRKLIDDELARLKTAVVNKKA